MRVIIAGARSLPNADRVVLDAVQKSEFKSVEVVLSGHYGSVDMAGEKFARQYGIDLEIYPPNWKGRGKAAGPYRNAVMVERADGLIALWDGRTVKSGTYDIITKAKDRGLEVYVHRL